MVTISCEQILPFRVLLKRDQKEMWHLKKKHQAPSKKEKKKSICVDILYRIYIEIYKQVSLEWGGRGVHPLMKLFH